ncbi:MAG: hypothetical protein ACK4QP_12380 [Pseudorhizobium sp.]
MKHLAVLLMFVSWLLSGAMPGIAAPAPATIDGAGGKQPAFISHSGYQPHHHEAVEHSGEISENEAPPQPCITSFCAKGFCAMCLTVFARPSTEVIRPSAFFYFVQHRSNVLVSSEPRRLERPPRTSG